MVAGGREPARPEAAGVETAGVDPASVETAAGMETATAAMSGGLG
jgi:hypothetical protein